MPEFKRTDRGNNGRKTLTVAEIGLFVFVACIGSAFPGAPPASVAGGVPLAAAMAMGGCGALLLFLVTRAWASRFRSPNAARNWLLGASAFTCGYVVFAIWYGKALNTKTSTFVSDLERTVTVVVGDSRTPHADSLVAVYIRTRKSSPSPSELLAYSGANELDRLPSLWTAEALIAAHNSLVFLYTSLMSTFVLSLATLLECYYSRLGSAEMEQAAGSGLPQPPGLGSASAS